MLLPVTFHPTLDLLLTQDRSDFLHGCGLPAAWAGQSQWRVLETGFGLGLNFLVTWQAWKNDPQRPRLLHYVSTDALPASPTALLRWGLEHPDLAPMAMQLSEKWHGLLPGIHRLSFEDGHVLLTLGIGETKFLRKEQSFEADSVYLDSDNPNRTPANGDPHFLKALARYCRRGTRLTCLNSSSCLVKELTQCGFEIRLPTRGAHLQAHFNPQWEPRKAADQSKPKQHSPARCIVIGAGLAGAACAASLARRGWQVTVLDTHETAAGGASALPVGMLAPHTSPDDSLLSRLSRHGLRATWETAKTLLRVDVDWQASGVLQRRFDASGDLPKHWPEAGEHWSRFAGPLERQALDAATGNAHLSTQNNGIPALWHASGGWIKPKRLVHALLATPGIVKQFGVKVAELKRSTKVSPDGCWQVFDADDNCVAEAKLVVLAAGFESAGLVPPCGSSTEPLKRPLPLQPIRGQVAWAAVTDTNAMPPYPVNGHGSFIPSFLSDDGDPSWLMGATFERDNNHADVKKVDQQYIFEKLQQLLPQTAGALKASFADGKTRDWAGVRCVSPDRLPVVGPLDDTLPGLYICTALGSRGLSFAVLCGELLAAGLHAEPLPIEKRLAQALQSSRHHLFL
jgi:tRNA 5-methylaminomethyl-2-thiouridine biosynthesis bifunctional protein